jgi:hypothetical protein
VAWTGPTLVDLVGTTSTMLGERRNEIAARDSDRIRSDFSRPSIAVDYARALLMSFRFQSVYWLQHRQSTSVFFLSADHQIERLENLVPLIKSRSN